MSDQAAPPTVPATTPQPTTLEQVVNNSLWNLPIPLPPGEAEPADVKDYKELHAAKVALLKKRLANLPTVVDDKTLDANQKALTALVKVRTGLNKARQGMFESVKKLKEDVDRYVGTTAESGLQAQIKALETPIEQAMQAYRDELERKRQEAERVLEERNNDRIAYILAGGMTFDGQKYSLGDLILWPVDLRNFGEPEWMGWIDKKLKPVIKLAEEAKAEEEAAFAKAQAEKEQKDREMRELFEKQRADQKRMDEERAELDRQKAEFRQQKNALRLEELKALGAEPQPDLAFDVEDDPYGTPDFAIGVSKLADQSDEKWAETKAQMRNAVVRQRELALFSGNGGGILGGHLLGWRTVCAVEFASHPRSALLARQRDGHLPHFPIWDDVRTFDGNPWRGSVDIVTGGFPCQDISIAGKGDGLDGERSGLWTEMARIIGQVEPPFVLVENSPMLTSRGLHRVWADLAALGYDGRHGVVGASDAGGSHGRDRIWILAHHFSLADTDMRRCLHAQLEEHAAA